MLSVLTLLLLLLIAVGVALAMRRRARPAKFPKGARGEIIKISRQIDLRLKRERSPDPLMLRESAPPPIRVGPVEKGSDAPARMPSGESIKLDENVQFTVYPPEVVAPMKWYPLLAFAHLSKRRPDAEEGEPDPVAAVRGMAGQKLGARAEDYVPRTADSSRAVPREGVITFQWVKRVENRLQVSRRGRAEGDSRSHSDASLEL